jgi:hypothetical protein
MKGKKTGGRKAGTPNKATRQIKEVIASIVDTEKLVKTLYRLSQGKQPNILAIRLLLEYQYGKPATSLCFEPSSTGKTLHVVFEDEKSGSKVDEQMKGKKTGGRVIGTHNKSTQEIKTLLDEVVDFRILIRKLYSMSRCNTPSGFYACRLLLEYKYGKVPERPQSGLTSDHIEQLRQLAIKAMEENS